jgi:hypothetical protein
VVALGVGRVGVGSTDTGGWRPVSALSVCGSLCSPHTLVVYALYSGEQSKFVHS